MAQRDWPGPARGVFETLLVREGEPVELDAHLARLSASVRRLYSAQLPAGVREAVLARAASLGPGLGRLRLTLAPAPDGSLHSEVTTAPVDAAAVFPSWERAIALEPFEIRAGLGAHKWADRSWIERTAHGESQGTLPLILDEGGEVLEASRCNVFAVHDGTLITPPADGRILPGIARALAIEAARSLGAEVREQSFALERLLAAGEAFLTNSIRGIEPVSAVGESALAPPGPFAARLAEEMKRTWGLAGAEHDATAA